MVAFSKNLPNAQILKQRKNQVIEATQELLKSDKSELFRGKGKNTKADIQKRLNLFEEMLSQVIRSN
jgi:gamma-glutamyl phosphate reductase